MIDAKALDDMHPSELEYARDFAEGRVVRVDGWILSRTEARLCAAVRLGAGR